MIKKITLESITEDMSGNNEIDYEYINSVIRIPEEKLKLKIRQLTFSEFLELQIAIEAYDDDKIIQLLDVGRHVGEGAGDNPYSGIRPGAGSASGMSSSSSFVGGRSADSELSNAASGLPSIKNPIPKINKALQNKPKSPADKRKQEITDYKPGDDVIVTVDGEQHDATVVRHEKEGTIVNADGQERLVPFGDERVEVNEPITDSVDLARLQELSGIDTVEETCSAGASGAGGIASMATPIGGMQKRNNPSIYTPKKIKKKNKKTK